MMGWILGIGIPLMYVVIGFITARLLYVFYSYPRWIKKVKAYRKGYRYPYDEGLNDHDWGVANRPFSTYGTGPLVLFGGIFWPVVVPGFLLWEYGRWIFVWPFQWVTKPPPLSKFHPKPEELHQEDWVTPR